ncbi:uncharacterized protein PGTG_19983 [Puccinia graminis f. sp. tritici CRL 75-36-700-3]|uniref:RNA polymerase II transcription factor B subunit 2 n=1 Tax=Puccinia graminis f. sp. tritici (strain CRL 75-36-700-3 / race SCCL) TaxID=418459 RepID=E3LC05_PUCGT|nr:uncharacterized protein PGTG_19983 [Puccinia graminis f. sp. tritici CRL 75-36-700-3]EFP94080.2 hypothetical protein PGTG_19983 [Puccinia graminis f. sp. tritici CRL 75-36-700-3]
MVGSRLPTKPSHNILSLLGQSGLMTSSDPRSLQSLKITSKGFGFLLEDVNTQLWDILLQYLKMTEANGLDVVDVLACLFMLGSLELGQEYSFSNWTPTQTQVLQDLVDYGLVLVSAPDRFYPTRLATTLTSTAPPLVSAERAQEEHGFLVLETNYRIYAYTSNPLQIAVLNLFLSLRYRFPNLVVGAVTRESIKSALSNGITADQVIMYLHTHAHPQMRKLEPLLPPTVVDQIRLWELEKNRIRAQEGYLYEDFKSAAEYDSVIQYSRKLGIVLWEHAGLRKLFVGYDGHLTLREFFRRGGASNGNIEQSRVNLGDRSSDLGSAWAAPDRLSCKLLHNTRRWSTTLGGSDAWRPPNFSSMDQHQSNHPMRSLLDKTYATSTSTQNIAILSPFVQLSFVFHLAIAQLQRHIQETPDCVVTVIGSSSQAAFQNTLADEHDAVLFTDSSSDCLTKTLLERIEFRSVSSRRPPQLLTLLCELGHSPVERPTLNDDEEDRGMRSPRIGLIITDLTSYLISLPTPTLSDLTRLLGFLSCTQTRLPSIHHHHHHPLQNPPPIYLVDRVDHNQKWPLSTPTADPEDLRNILEIFRHFFAQIWTIDGLHETDSNTGDDSPTTTPTAVGTSSSPKPGRYRLYSLRSAADSSADDDDQITYQVLEQEALDPEYSAHPERLLRKTVVVPGC